MLNSKLTLLLPQGFDFGAPRLLVLNLLAPFLVTGHAVAGVLIDPKVLVQSFSEPHTRCTRDIPPYSSNLSHPASWKSAPCSDLRKVEGIRCQQIAFHFLKILNATSYLAQPMGSGVVLRETNTPFFFTNCLRNSGV